MAQKNLSFFITFEGSEGCGKSTQSKMLFNYLKQNGFKAVYLREPGGTKVSEKIRQVLLDPKSVICPQAETLLYMAARAQLVQDFILPALKKKQIVICDRFLDSTLAYQGYGLGMDLKAIRRIGDFCCQGIKPDLTIFLDLPLEKGLKHRQNNQDRIESRAFSFHQQVREGYLKLAQLEPKRIKVIKVNEKKNVTQALIRKEVLDVI